MWFTQAFLKTRSRTSMPCSMAHLPSCFQPYYHRLSSSHGITALWRLLYDIRHQACWHIRTIHWFYIFNSVSIFISKCVSCIHWACQRSNLRPQQARRMLETHSQGTKRWKEIDVWKGQFLFLLPWEDKSRPMSTIRRRWKQILYMSFPDTVPGNSNLQGLDEDIVIIGWKRRWARLTPPLNFELHGLIW